jgi:hypothetical protein
MKYCMIPIPLPPPRTRPCPQDFRRTTHNKQPVPRQSRLHLSLSPHFSNLLTATFPQFVTRGCHASSCAQAIYSSFLSGLFPSNSARSGRHRLFVPFPVLFAPPVCDCGLSRSPAQPWPSCFSAVFCSTPPSPATFRASILHLTRWPARGHAHAAS